MARWLVKEIAESKGITRYKLSKDTGMPFSSIDAIWQNEAQRIDRSTLDKLARALEVTPRDLIGNGETESEAQP
jgi:DNA-binding Xre family transcriptional regulator